MSGYERTLLAWARDEIANLRRINAELAPKAEAYDRLGTLIDSMVPRQCAGGGDDVVWRIDKHLARAADVGGLKGCPEKVESATQEAQGGQTDPSTADQPFDAYKTAVGDVTAAETKGEELDAVSRQLMGEPYDTPRKRKTPAMPRAADEAGSAFDDMLG